MVHRQRGRCADLVLRQAGDWLLGHNVKRRFAPCDEQDGRVRCRPRCGHKPDKFHPRRRCRAASSLNVIGLDGFRPEAGCRRSSGPQESDCERVGCRRMAGLGASEAARGPIRRMPNSAWLTRGFRAQGRTAARCRRGRPRGCWGGWWSAGISCERGRGARWAIDVWLKDERGLNEPWTEVSLDLRTDVERLADGPSPWARGNKSLWAALS